MPSMSYSSKQKVVGDRKEVVGKKGPSYCVWERWSVVEIKGNVGGGVLHPPCRGLNWGLRERRRVMASS